MTRPLYEPTSQRQIRKLGFSADQLFRRPAPRTDSSDVPWVRLMMESPDQTVPTHPAAPQINFTTYWNDYPATFDVQADGFGVLSVELLEDGVYHTLVYINTDTIPTNGFYLSISGDNQIMEMGEDFVTYIPPLAYPYNTFGVTFRGGPTRQLNVYAFVRTISGNAAFDIGWADTFMEIYQLGLTSPSMT